MHRVSKDQLYGDWSSGVYYKYIACPSITRRFDWEIPTSLALHQSSHPLLDKAHPTFQTQSANMQAFVLTVTLLAGTAISSFLATCKDGKLSGVNDLSMQCLDGSGPNAYIATTLNMDECLEYNQQQQKIIKFSESIPNNGTDGSFDRDCNQCFLFDRVGPVWPGDRLWLGCTCRGTKQEFNLNWEGYFVNNYGQLTCL
jgi:hypothetical protein